MRTGLIELNVVHAFARAGTTSVFVCPKAPGASYDEQLYLVKSRFGYLAMKLMAKRKPWAYQC